jgi:biopolymer transport protein ExbB
VLRKFNEITDLAGAGEALLEYLTAGGAVMWPILGIGIALSFALGFRHALLRRGSNKNVRVLLRRAEQGRSSEPDGIVDEAIARGLALKRSGRPNLRRYLDEAFGEFDTDLKRYRILIATAVAIAPLLGLLGTVTGMIETFESLSDMALFTQSGGIAAGIATALFTTQMGLVVAVPGVIAKTILDKRQFRIEMDLAQIKDMLCGTESAQPADAGVAQGAAT